MRFVNYILPILTFVCSFSYGQTTLKPSSSITPCLGEYTKAWFTTTYSYDSVQWINNKNQIVSKLDTLSITPLLTPTAGLYYFDLKLFKSGTSYPTSRLFVVPFNGFDFSINNDTTICSGDSMLIKVSNPSNTTLKLKWYSDVTGFIPPSNTTTTQHKVHKPGNYWVTATNQNETCTLVDTMSLLLLNQPVKLIDDKIICENESIVLENLNPESIGTTHVWKYNGKTSSSATLTPIESGKYTLITTTNPTKCNFSDSVTITINPVPKVDLTPSKTLCKDESFIIQNLLSNPSLSYTTNWESNTSLPVIPPGQEVISVTQAGKYKLTLNTGSCKASDSTVLSLLSFEVELGKNIPDTCTNKGVSLYNLKANTEPSTTFYLWKTPYGNFFQKNISAQQKGYYYLTVTSDSPQCEINDSVYIGIAPIPVFDLGNDIIEENSFTVFDGSFSGTFPESKYDFVWKESNTDSIYSSKSKLIIEKPGTHLLSLLIENKTSKCSSTDYFTITIPGSPNIASHVLFIPDAFSPSSLDSENSKVKVLGPDISNEDFNFKIFNRWGQIIFETTDFEFISTEGWSGEGETLPSQNGTYTYTAQGKFIDGETFKEKGTITLLR